MTGTGDELMIRAGVTGEGGLKLGKKGRELEPENRTIEEKKRGW